MSQSLSALIVILITISVLLFLVKYLKKYTENTSSKVHSYNDKELFSILEGIGAIQINIGSPLYTYINLLDKWYILDKNPNFGPLKSPLEKAIFLAKIRLYSKKNIEKLFKDKIIKNSRDAIILLLDYEFIEDAPKNIKKTYTSMRKEFIKEIIPHIEKAYLEKRGITKEDLDPGSTEEFIKKELQNAECVFPRLVTKDGKRKNI